MMNRIKPTGRSRYSARVTNRSRGTMPRKVGGVRSTVGKSMRASYGRSM